MNIPDDADDLSGFDPNEAMKLNSHYLRGTILESIADPVTGSDAFGRQQADQVSWHLPAG